jgi:hypothetical protein
MNAHPEVAHLAREERIRAIAYALWEEEGRPEGRAEEHWYRACELIDAEAAPQPELAADPDWLKREAPPPVAAEKPSALEQIVKRMSSTKAA